MAPDRFQNRYIGRFRVLLVILGVVVLVLAGRLFEVQILNASEYVQPNAVRLADERRAPRGSITDRNGYLLATDEFNWTVAANPSQFTVEEDRLQASICLQELLDIPATEISAKLQQDGGYVVLGQGAKRDVAALLNGHQYTPVDGSEGPSPSERIAANICGDSLQGKVWASPYRVRYYPQDRYFSHLIGFVTIGDGDSYYGVEENHRSFLQGTVGPELHLSSRKPLPDAFGVFLPSDVGHDLILTIDWRIQEVIVEALEDAIWNTGSSGGTIMVMDPKTGALLASASYPNYNPNTYFEYQGDSGVFGDPAVSRLYEPGSVFKIVTTAAGLDSGAIAPGTVFNDPGEWEVATRIFRNSNRRAHGLVSATDILAQSLNVGIIQVAQYTGAETFYDYVENFGFGQKTQVDLAHEAGGVYKEPGERDFSKADFAANSFGQGISTTPLQVLSSFATIANGGLLMRPHVAVGFVTDGRLAEREPEPIRQVISPEAANLLTEMMVVAVERGAPEALIDECDVAGKTGTAEIAYAGGYYEDVTIASFGAFAPAYDPAFACLIKLDRPQTSIWGAETAAPVFRDIGPRILRILRVRPTGARHSAGIG